MTKLWVVANPKGKGYQELRELICKLHWRDYLDKELMLQFFEYKHLPENLQAISKPYCELALNAVATQPRNPERTAGLRKLLEAKDCAVRAVLYKGE